MKLDWLGKHRKIVSSFYRSANGYSQICKLEIFGREVKFSLYEVQIMEHIMEYGDENRNMKWYAQQLGLSQATYSRYVKQLVIKGLVEKYHAENNQKNIILRVSELGIREYRIYAEESRTVRFPKLLERLDTLTPEQWQAVEDIFVIWGDFHHEPAVPSDEADTVKLIKIVD